MLSPAEVHGKAQEAAGYLSDTLGHRPRIAVVLGTGWADLAAGHKVLARVDFDDVPGFNHVSARGQSSTITVVETAGGPVLVQGGRLHCYEGYTSLESSFPIWAYGSLGVKVLILLAAAGGLNPLYMPGDLIVIKDHIYLWGTNPLIGVPEVEGCEHFVFAADFYPENLQEALKAAVPPDARCEQGVYAFTSGPSFETESEATLLRVAGADVVGMSTAPEAIVGRYLGMRVGAMCCVSNVLLPFRSGGEDLSAVLAMVRRTVAGLDGFLDRLASSADMII
jgi:purine-nucleoside phosphorylase